MTARPNHWFFRNGKPVPADALADFTVTEREILTGLADGPARLDGGRWRGVSGCDFSTATGDRLIGKGAVYTLADGRMALTNYGRAKAAEVKRRKAALRKAMR